MSIRALIFDFDGLILDTETPESVTWQAIYREHGHEFPAERWGSIIGGNGAAHFDAAAHLAELTRGAADAASLRARHKAGSDALVLAQPVLPGVVEMLDQARHLSLRLGIASSSEHAWVDTHLTRLGLFERFESTTCVDDVPAGRAKPHPDLYLKALAALNAQADETIAFEDSPNGVRAARAAGIFVVAVPNPTTAALKVEGAGLRLDSLTQVSLDDLIRRLA